MSHIICSIVDAIILNYQEYQVDWLN